MKKRLLAPDFIKGVAIVLMVYGHLTMVGTCASFQNHLTGWIYSFHMPLFLLVSGMFFSSKGEFSKKGKRLLLRIGVPYIFFISVYLVGLKLIQIIGIPTSNASPESITEFVKIVFLYPRGGYWFLHSLLLIQLSFFLGQALARWMAQKDAFVAGLFAALFMLGLVACDVLQSRTILYFLIGMAIQAISGRTLKISMLVGWGGVALVWGMSHFLQPGAIRQFSFFEVVWCICIFAGIWALADRFPQAGSSRVIAWIGMNSLPILVFHAIFIVLLKPVAGVCTRVEPSGWLYSLGATVIVMTLCLLLAHICDRLRLSRYLFGSPQCYMPLQQDAQRKFSKIEQR